MTQVCTNQLCTDKVLATPNAMHTAPSHWSGRVAVIRINSGYLPHCDQGFHDICLRQFALVAVVKLTRHFALNRQSSQVSTDLFSSGFGKPGIRVDKAHCPQTTEKLATTNAEVRGHCEFFAHCSHCWRVEDDKRKVADVTVVSEQKATGAIQTPQQEHHKVGDFSDKRMISGNVNAEFLRRLHRKSAS